MEPQSTSAGQVAEQKYLSQAENIRSWSLWVHEGHRLPTALLERSSFQFVRRPSPNRLRSNLHIRIRFNYDYTGMWSL